MELLAPPPGRRAECQHDIGLALDRVESGAAAARSFRVAGSKKGKAGLRRYCARYDGCALPTVLSIRRSGLGSASQKQHTSPGSRPSSTARSQTPRRFSTGRHRLRGVMPAATRPQWRRHTTCSEWWGHKAAVTRGGKWEQLAKILTGDLTVDLFDHLREFKRSPSPTVEKLRGANSIVYRTRRR